MAYHRIFVPLDFSPISQLVWEQALDIAQQHHALVMLFHCIPFYSYLPEGQFFGQQWGGVSEQIRDSLAQQKEETLAAFQVYARQAEERGLSIEWDWKVGEVGYWIAKTVESWGADLMVIGHRQLSGLPERLMGSVTQYVIHRVPCSVLMVRGTGV